MLIMLSTEEEIVEGLRSLATLYPNETTLRMETITDDLQHNLSSEIPIQRITFLGHADDMLFGDMSPEAFASQLIHILNTTQNNAPGFLNQLEAIDLLGCDVGNMTANGESYVTIVAEHLKKAGFQIPLHAFTNKGMENEPIFATTLLIKKPADDHWLYSGLQEREDYDRYEQYMEEGRILTIKSETIKTAIYDDHQESNDLLSENEDMEALVEVSQDEIDAGDHISEDNKEDNEFPDSPQDYLNLAKETIQENNNQINALKIKIEASKVTLEQIEKDTKQISNKINGLFTTIAKTTNPRAYFHQQPNCNFMSTANISQHYKNKLQMHNASLEEHSNDRTQSRDADDNEISPSPPPPK